MAVHKVHRDDSSFRHGPGWFKWDLRHSPKRIRHFSTQKAWATSIPTGVLREHLHPCALIYFTGLVKKLNCRVIG